MMRIFYALAMYLVITLGYISDHWSDKEAGGLVFVVMLWFAICNELPSKNKWITLGFMPKGGAEHPYTQELRKSEIIRFYEVYGHEHMAVRCVVETSTSEYPVVDTLAEIREKMK